MLSLEPTWPDTVRQDVRTDTSAIVAELRAIKALVSHIAQAQAEGIPAATIDQLLAEIARLVEILAHPLLSSGQVKHTLKPGWMWTCAHTNLIQEGKRLHHAIDDAPIEAPATEQPPF